jgi:polygalacturonase
MRSSFLIYHLLITTVCAATPKPSPIISLADFSCLDALAKLSNGGGTLLVPTGVWLCPPLNLTSNTVVYLESGGILKADVKADWPSLQPLPNYRVSHDHPLQGKPRLAPFLGGFNVTNLTIGGGNGTIDGSGLWFYETPYINNQHTRPSLFECVYCTNMVLEDVTFANSSFWTIHPVLSNNLRASRISIINPTTGDPLLVPNTDGFDPDSTSNVLLEDSYIAVNDDAVAIKAGWDCAGYKGVASLPSSNITIRNLTVWRGGGGISIGSEMSGGVSNVYVTNVLLQHGSYGIYVKTGDTRGGYVRNVTINNVTIVNALKKAVAIDAFYG